MLFRSVVGWFTVGVPPGGGKGKFGPLHFGGWLVVRKERASREGEMRTAMGGSEK